MDEYYESARTVIKNVLGESASETVNEFIKKCEKVMHKIIEKGEKSNLDLSKILGLAQALHIIKKKKSSRAKRLIMALIIASLTALTIGMTIKSYAKVKKGKTLEEKIKIFIDSLELEKLRDNPAVKKIRDEIKSLMEQ